MINQTKYSHAKAYQTLLVSLLISLCLFVLLCELVSIIVFFMSDGFSLQFKSCLKDSENATSLGWLPFLRAGNGYSFKW